MRVEINFHSRPGNRQSGLPYKLPCTLPYTLQYKTEQKSLKHNRFDRRTANCQIKGRFKHQPYKTKILHTHKTHFERKFSLIIHSIRHILPKGSTSLKASGYHKAGKNLNPCNSIKIYRLTMKTYYFDMINVEKRGKLKNSSIRIQHPRSANKERASLHENIKTKVEKISGKKPVIFVAHHLTAILQRIQILRFFLSNYSHAVSAINPPKYSKNNFAFSIPTNISLLTNINHSRYTNTPTTRANEACRTTTQATGIEAKPTHYTGQKNYRFLYISNKIKTRKVQWPLTNNKGISRQQRMIKTLINE
jgi:hypothetical protein